VSTICCECVRFFFSFHYFHYFCRRLLQCCNCYNLVSLGYRNYLNLHSSPKREVKAGKIIPSKDATHGRLSCIIKTRGWLNDWGLGSAGRAMEPTIRHVRLIKTLGFGSRIRRSRLRGHTNNDSLKILSCPNLLSTNRPNTFISALAR
jgi:hypothetical protein